MSERVYIATYLDGGDLQFPEKKLDIGVYVTGTAHTPLVVGTSASGALAYQLIWPCRLFAIYGETTPYSGESWSPAVAASASYLQAGSVVDEVAPYSVFGEYGAAVGDLLSTALDLATEHAHIEALAAQWTPSLAETVAAIREHARFAPYERGWLDIATATGDYVIDATIPLLARARHGELYAHAASVISAAAISLAVPHYLQREQCLLLYGPWILATHKNPRPLADEGI